MYKATIVNHGIRVTKTGDSIAECLTRLQDHLKTFHGETHRLTYSGDDSSMTIYTISGADSRQIGSLDKELPSSHDDGV